MNHVLQPFDLAFAFCHGFADAALEGNISDTLTHIMATDVTEVQTSHMCHGQAWIHLYVDVATSHWP
jgi:hypothetical protein